MKVNSLWLTVFFIIQFSLHPFTGESFQERITSERLRGSMLTHNTLELKNTFDEMKDSGMNSAVRRQIMDDLKAGFGLTTFILNWDDGDDNIKITHANERILYVSPEFQLNENLANGVGFTTIQGALDHINSQDLITAADQKTSWVVNIESGSYDESLTVSAGRLVTLNALGRVTLGDGASNNFGSTTPRDITWYQNSSAEVGSVVPTLFINATSCPEQTAADSKNSFYAGGWDISGNFNVANYTGIGTRYQLHVYGVKVRGNVALTTVSTDTLDTYLLQCNLGGNWSDSTTAFPANNLLKVENCKIDGTVACRDYGRIVSSKFGGTITQRNELSTDITGAGFWNCKLASSSGFNGAATLVYDENTRYLTTGDSTTALTNPGAGDVYAVTQSLADTSVENLDFKESCKVTTTGEIILNWEQTIEGVAVVAGDRVLVKNQSDAKENGIYVAAASGGWSRSPDMDGSPTGEVSAGNNTTIEQGSTLAGTNWVTTGDGTLEIGVDNINWIRIDVSSITAGNGLTLSGSTLVLGAADTTITVNADSIEVNKGAAYNWTGIHTFANTDASNDKDSGSIVCEGGVGIEKNLNVGGTVNIASTLPSTSSTTGALTVDGGLGVSDSITTTNYVLEKSPSTAYRTPSTGTISGGILVPGWIDAVRTDVEIITVAGGTVWTLKKSGWYRLNYSIYMRNVDLSNILYQMDVFKNGTTIVSKNDVFDATFAPEDSGVDRFVSVQGSIYLKVDANDTFSVRCTAADAVLTAWAHSASQGLHWQYIGSD